MATQEQKIGMKRIFKELSDILEMTMNKGKPLDIYIAMRSKDNQNGNIDFITSDTNPKNVVSVLEELAERIKSGGYDELKKKEKNSDNYPKF